MSMRRWYTDFEVNDKFIIITVDITGIEPEDLWIGVSSKFNSLILKTRTETKDISIPVKVKENFEHYINNSVLIITIERLIE